MPSTDYPCNNLDPDQARHEVVSELDSNCMTLWRHSLNDFQTIRFWKKNLADDKRSMHIFPEGKEFINLIFLLISYCWFFRTSEWLRKSYT